MLYLIPQVLGRVIGQPEADLDIQLAVSSRVQCHRNTSYLECIAHDVKSPLGLRRSFVPFKANVMESAEGRYEEPSCQ